MNDELIRRNREYIEKINWFANNYSKTESIRKMLKVCNIEITEYINYGKPYNRLPVLPNQSDVIDETKVLTNLINDNIQEIECLQNQINLLTYKYNRQWKNRLKRLIFSLLKKLRITKN